MTPEQKKEIEELLALSEKHPNACSCETVREFLIELGSNAYFAKEALRALLDEVERLKEFCGLYTGFDVNDPAQNAARYDGYLDGIQVGMEDIPALEKQLAERRSKAVVYAKDLEEQTARIEALQAQLKERDALLDEAKSALLKHYDGQHFSVASVILKILERSK